MTEVVGYAAASAVLASFLMRSMVPLRLVAILSNILFLSYGYLADIAPVLVLHAALLPINVARLAITQRDGKVLDRPSQNRYLAPASARIRHIALFVLGVAVGSLGMRAVMHVVLAFFHQGPQSFV